MLVYQRVTASLPLKSSNAWKMKLRFAIIPIIQPVFRSKLLVSGRVILWNATIETNPDGKTRTLKTQVILMDNHDIPYTPKN